MRGMIEEYIMQTAAGDDVVHCKRFGESWQWLEPYLTKGARLLDVGGDSGLSRAIRHFRPDLQFDTTKGCDLRYEWPNDTGVYDVEVCTEVIEHIHDRPDMGGRDGWYGTGVEFFLSECRRVLKVGGHLFLTTPNIASWPSVYRVMQGCHPMNYLPHVREYTASQIENMLTGVGFTMVRFSTYDSWNRQNITDDWVNKVIKATGCPTLRRGENTFAIARKI